LRNSMAGLSRGRPISFPSSKPLSGPEPLTLPDQFLDFEMSAAQNFLHCGGRNVVRRFRQDQFTRDRRINNSGGGKDFRFYLMIDAAEGQDRVDVLIQHKLLDERHGVEFEMNIDVEPIMDSN